MNQFVPHPALSPGLAKADETHVTSRIYQLVGADRRIGDHAAPGPDPTWPVIGVVALGTQRLWRRGLAQFQQKHRCGFERIVEDIVGERCEAGSLEWLALLVHQQGPRISPGL